mmetsp:Transcript_2604/g.5719  ORF Transcript_2604/g.5719 Transcript_2604/m.5719 type:complete len:144 (-) Transcript_2604:40-471(-)
MASGSQALAPNWDPGKGVWVGQKAVTGTEEIPRPLIIFGYGSLCWRPDTTLEAYESFPGTVKGWTRLFAQRSTDHRGTPARPGLVATLVEHHQLAGLPGFGDLERAGLVSPETLGKAYVVPDEDAPRVLEELDFREKGGCAKS